MRDPLALAANRSTSSLGAAAALVLTATLMGIAFPVSAPAADSAYEMTTSAPEGRAVCTIKGSIKKGPSAQLQVMLSPSLGEGRLDFAIASKGPSSPTVIDGVAAGTQAGCDVFPDTPSSVMVPLGPLPGKFSGVLDLHAHPGSDCGSAGSAEGTVTISTGATMREAKLARPKCDTDASHANLQIRAGAPATGSTGEIQSQSAHIENHGPGEAAAANVSAKLSRGLVPVNLSATKGACHFDPRNNVVNCALGPLAPLAAADVSIEAIPVKPGASTTKWNVAADNAGNLLPRNAIAKGNIAKGNNAILTVTLKCKGAGGTVTINPNGAGGVTTCTCPDPNDATLEQVTCIETYAQNTTVTLTSAATKGAFNKWTGACTGNAAACMVTMNPAAQNPDQSTTAKFK